MNLGFHTRDVDAHHPLARWAAWGIGLLLIVAAMVVALMFSS
ncbi:MULTISPECIES: hypothetical protein [unclassified Nocardioides]|nr:MULTISPECIES: hypothetical protein [unclassified Nocardioides]